MRKLTQQEISTLTQQGCSAEDWNAIDVAENFATTYIRNVQFYGNIKLGVYDKTVEVAPEFERHTGIFNATLRNVEVGDNCLIDHIGNFINNYTIGHDCVITNVASMSATSDATFGEGTVISVLNEVGEGNIMLYSGLTSQMAALMVRYEGDKEFSARLRELISCEIADMGKNATVGNGVRITNTQQIVNTRISDGSEIEGATRLADSSIVGTADAPVHIGAGVICEKSIISNGSKVLNSAKLQNCFVGEACCIVNGFTAESSVFFANSYMANGEACAAFCGPFTTSHHKSSLLIGASFLFYNAGSSTNLSNHAYKMGPLHYGHLERGVKTASGAYILMPAKIGQFSVCLGKLMYHPDTRKLPFSYLISYNDEHMLVPGRNLTTAGLYRDIRKWPKRDKRTTDCRQSIINFDWLSPFSVGRIITAKRTLESLQKISGEKVQSYNFQDYVIKATSLRKGIKYYDIALRIYMGAVMKRHILTKPTSDTGKGKWSDLSGLLWPMSEEQRVVEEVKNGTITSAQQIVGEFVTAHRNYAEYRWNWSYRLLCEYYEVDEITEELAERIHNDYVTARRAWIAEIKKDAIREYEQGDVDEDTLNSFLADLAKEVEFENLRYDM